MYMVAKANEKVYGAAKKANEEFIAKIAKTAGVKALPGGVYYKEVKAVQEHQTHSRV